MGYSLSISDCHNFLFYNKRRLKKFDIKYHRLHRTISKKLGKPKKCAKCGSESAKKYEWANVSKRYLEDLSDWIRLCTGCHRIFDRTSKGERNPCAKLDYRKAVSVRALHAMGDTQRYLAKIHGVSQATISYIINFKKWI